MFAKTGVIRTAAVEPDLPRTGEEASLLVGDHLHHTAAQLTAQKIEQAAHLSGTGLLYSNPILLGNRIYRDFHAIKR